MAGKYVKQNLPQRYLIRSVGGFAQTFSFFLLLNAEVVRQQALPLIPTASHRTEVEKKSRVVHVASAGTYVTYITQNQYVKQSSMPNIEISFRNSTFAWNLSTSC